MFAFYGIIIINDTLLITRCTISLVVAAVCNCWRNKIFACTGATTGTAIGYDFGKKYIVNCICFPSCRLPREQCGKWTLKSCHRRFPRDVGSRVCVTCIYGYCSWLNSVGFLHCRLHHSFGATRAQRKVEFFPFFPRNRKCFRRLFCAQLFRSFWFVLMMRLNVYQRCIFINTVSAYTKIKPRQQLGAQHTKKGTETRQGMG